MKKLSLMIAALALAGVACGDSDSKKAAGDAGVDAGSIKIPDAGGNVEEDPFPACVREDVAVYPPYDGKKEFTEGQLTACQNLCMRDQACYTEANCPGLDAYTECANAALIDCATTDAKAKCRTQWEDYICCSDEAACDAETTQEGFDACIDKSCSKYIMGIQGCLMNAPQACVTRGQQECLVAGGLEDAGSDTDAGAEMMPKARTSSSKPMRLPSALSGLRVTSAR